jgi:hypothetical protein
MHISRQTGGTVYVPIYSMLQDIVLSCKCLVVLVVEVGVARAVSAWADTFFSKSHGPSIFTI